MPHNFALSQKGHSIVNTIKDVTENEIRLMQLIACEEVNEQNIENLMGLQYPEPHLLIQSLWKKKLLK